jgi:hypothetical protein
MTWTETTGGFTQRLFNSANDIDKIVWNFRMFRYDISRGNVEILKSTPTLVANVTGIL